MFYFPLLEPLSQILSKKFIFEILAPESAILHARLGEASI
jgi:hypothetical protein